MSRISGVRQNRKRRGSIRWGRVLLFIVIIAAICGMVFFLIQLLSTDAV